MGAFSSGPQDFEQPMSFRLTRPAVLPVWRTPSAIAPADKPDPLEQQVVALFDQFRNPLLRYLSSFGLAPADAEEIIQEVFLSLFQHLQRGKSRENLRGWLFRVAHNLGLKRRYRTRREFDLRAEAGAEDLAVDPNPSPETQAVNSQAQQRLLAVVEALPEQHRRCLFLRAEGLRYREIAGILDMSLGAVSLSLAGSLARIARAAER
jgi:RNA polymerase sigma-70 factor, ECF subfamily